MLHSIQNIIQPRRSPDPSEKRISCSRREGNDLYSRGKFFHQLGGNLSKFRNQDGDDGIGRRGKDDRHHGNEELRKARIIIFF